MARIAGVDIPNSKRIEIALTYIYGIGRKSANDILARTGIDPDKRAKDLTDEDVAKIRDEIEAHYTVEGDLRQQARYSEDPNDDQRQDQKDCDQGFQKNSAFFCHGFPSFFREYSILSLRKSFSSL